MNLILPGNVGLGAVAKLSDYLPENGVLAQRIEKYGRAKQRSLQMLGSVRNTCKKLSLHIHAAIGNGMRPLLKKQAGLLRACGTWLHFAYYFGWLEEELAYL